MVSDVKIKAIVDQYNKSVLLAQEEIANMLDDSSIPYELYEYGYVMINFTLHPSILGEPKNVVVTNAGKRFGQGGYDTFDKIRSLISITKDNKSFIKDLIVNLEEIAKETGAIIDVKPFRQYRLKFSDSLPKSSLDLLGGKKSKAFWSMPDEGYHGMSIDVTIPRSENVEMMNKINDLYMQ